MTARSLVDTRAPETSRGPGRWPADATRAYVPTDTCGTVEGCRVGVAWLMRQARDSSGEPLLVVPSEAYSYRNEYLSAATSQSRWTTSLAYKAAAAHGWPGGPTLLVFPDHRVLEWFDRLAIVTGLCVVQGVRHNTTAWATAFRPEDLTTGRPFEGRVDLDAVVAEAMRGLRLSDGWRGLTAAADIALAVRTLRLLRKGGHEFSPQDLEAWALADRWSPSAALRLRMYATKVAGGRLIALRSMVRPPRGALHRWRQAAAQRAPETPATPLEVGTSEVDAEVTQPHLQFTVDRDRGRRLDSAGSDDRPRHLIHIESASRDVRPIRVQPAPTGVVRSLSYRR